MNRGYPPINDHARKLQLDPSRDTEPVTSSESDSPRNAISDNFTLLVSDIGSSLDLSTFASGTSSSGCHGKTALRDFCYVYRFQPAHYTHDPLLVFIRPLLVFSGNNRFPLMSAYILPPLGICQQNVEGGQKKIMKDKLLEISKEKQKLLSRIKRLAGQIDAAERSVREGDECADILMLLAAIRGGVNSLMAEILEDHIRLHITHPNRGGESPEELTEDLISLVRAYLK